MTAKIAEVQTGVPCDGIVSNSSPDKLIETGYVKWRAPPSVSIGSHRSGLGKRSLRRLAAFVIRLARRCLKSGHARVAFYLLRGLADVAPQITSVRVWFARAALRNGEPLLAQEMIQPHQVDRLPDVRRHYHRLADLHLKMENADAAGHYLRLATNTMPWSSRAWHLNGLYNNRRENLDEAVECFQQEARVVQESRQSEALFKAAHSLSLSGRRKQAIAAYESVIEHFPTASPAYFGLVNASSEVNANHPLIDRIRELLDSKSDIDKVPLHFAMGRAYDRSDDVGRAFAHFLLGNRLKAAKSECKYSDPRSSGEARRNIFSKALIERLSSSGCSDDFLICIVGMPRSGTTLVEQILAEHSQVRALGERRDFQEVATTLPTKLKSRKNYPDCCVSLSPEVVEYYAKYIRDLFRKAAHGRMRCVTKLPGDVWELGLIKILFPRARIIHMTRHPLDTCLSCFMQIFDIPFARDLDLLATEYLSYQKIVQHWRDVLPMGSILDVSYESLVAESEPMVRRICEFSGLPFEQECMGFYRAKRLVNTVSHWQVRQPVYQSSVGRSDRYREFLGPLLALQSG